MNGFFGGMGGCAMVAQTLVNLNAGARTRLSAIVGALTILGVILFGAPIIEQIPMAALVGVMMMVAIHTFQWVSFRIIRKMPPSDIFIGILVAAITVLLHNLAVAVLSFQLWFLLGTMLKEFVPEKALMLKGIKFMRSTVHSSLVPLLPF